MSKKITPVEEGKGWDANQNYTPVMFPCSNCPAFDYLIFSEVDNKLICSKCFNFAEGWD